MADERDDLGVDEQELAGFAALEPPAGFVDRVMNARVSAPTTEPLAPAERKPQRAWRERALVAVVAAAAAVALTFGLQRVPSGPASGEVQTASRREIPLGARGVAVAEGGAKLSWTVARGGATHVEQRAGRVFYRVEPGEEFIVNTPAGRVLVRGTCFDVEVRDMSTETLLHHLGRGKQLAMGAVAGAALASAVLVTVYEGRVDVESAGRTESLAAGETALATAETAPARVPAKVAALEEENALLARQERALKDQVDELEGQLKVVMTAHANGADPLVAENKSLRDELRAMKSELSAFKQERAQRAGEPVPWPEDVPAAYREDGIKRAIVDAIQKAGLEGDLQSIDCSEFPCVAWGEITTPGDKEDNARALKRFEEGLRGTYPDDGHNMHQSVWSKSERTEDGSLQHRSMFGIAVYPDDSVDDETGKQVQKRLRWRNQQYMDAVVSP